MKGAAAARSAGGPADYSILIIDDHQLFSTALMIALRNKGFAASTVDVSSVEAILTRSAALSPGLAVLDLLLSKDADSHQINGIDLVGPLRSQGWKVLVVSGSRDDSQIAAAIAAGAVDSVPKASSFETLVRHIMVAVQGHSMMSEAERHDWLNRHRSYQEEKRQLFERLGRLSTREREVLVLLAEGYRAADVAERSVVSLSTVRTQIRSILTKLEVNSQVEAVALAFRCRWW
jgi:DNA-binding NarL/FixJ family response regulator